MGVRMSELFERIRSHDRICPECLSIDFYRVPLFDGSEETETPFELVCSQCGMVLREENNVVRDIALEIETHQPESPLDFEVGKVGTYLRDRDLYQAVPSLTDGFHFGERLARKRELKKVVAPTTPPLRALLNCGSQTLTKIGLRTNPVIGNSVASLLTQTFACLDGKITNRQQVVNLAIQLTLVQRLGSEKAEPYLAKLPAIQNGLRVYGSNGGLTVE